MLEISGSMKLSSRNAGNDGADRVSGCFAAHNAVTVLWIPRSSYSTILRANMSGTMSQSYIKPVGKVVLFLYTRLSWEESVFLFIASHTLNLLVVLNSDF